MVVLVSLGMCFVIGSIWHSAVRSTIPLELDAVVTKKERRIEKSPGVDDVYLVTVDKTRTLQVDRTVYDAVKVGQRIEKDEWSELARVDGRTIDLVFSADFYGLVWVALAAVLAMLFLLYSIF